MNNQANYWDFIAAYLPGYESDDRVLLSDILFRFLNNEEVNEKDIAYIKSELKNTDGVIAELKRIDLMLLSEAMDSYYEKI